MTTFTMQDLTPEQILNDHLNAPEVPRETKDVLVGVLGSMHVSEGKSAQMGEVLPNPDLININNICTQLHQLLTTIINQSKAQPNTTPPEGNQSLQECVSLTLQQADWFKDLIRHELVALDIAEIAKDAVEDIVENEVESYFDNRFSPEDHFDFVDAVGDAVDDRLDDVVREKLDDVVQEQLEEVVAEKLGSANLTITF